MHTTKVKLDTIVVDRRGLLSRGLFYESRFARNECVFCTFDRLAVTPKHVHRESLWHAEWTATTKWSSSWKRTCNFHDERHWTKSLPRRQPFGTLICSFLSFDFVRLLSIDCIVDEVLNRNMILTANWMRKGCAKLKCKMWTKKEDKWLALPLNSLRFVWTENEGQTNSTEKWIRKISQKPFHFAPFLLSVPVCVWMRLLFNEGRQWTECIFSKTKNDRKERFVFAAIRFRRRFCVASCCVRSSRLAVNENATFAQAKNFLSTMKRKRKFSNKIHVTCTLSHVVKKTENSKWRNLHENEMRFRTVNKLRNKLNCVFPFSSFLL